MTLHGKLIVGMHLHREVLMRIDELDKQWEMIAKLCIDLLADELFLVFLDQGRQIEPLVFSCCHDTLLPWKVADFPRFADIMQVGIDSLERSYLFATPNGGFQK